VGFVGSYLKIKISRRMRGENNVPRARIELARFKKSRDFKSLVSIVSRILWFNDNRE